MTDTRTALLRELVAACPDDLPCEQFHHFRADRHSPMSTCGPKERYMQALNAAELYLRSTPAPEPAPQPWPNPNCGFPFCKCNERAAEPVSGVVQPILAELARATAKFPTWPTDPLHAVGVLGEEFGELQKEVLQLVYEPHKTSAEEVAKEALQTAAMALRFYASLSRYEYKPGPQHKQENVK